jgi:hypothetical protein
MLGGRLSLWWAGPGSLKIERIVDPWGPHVIVRHCSKRRPSSRYSSRQFSLWLSSAVPDTQLPAALPAGNPSKSSEMDSSGRSRPVQISEGIADLGVPSQLWISNISLTFQYFVHEQSFLIQKHTSAFDGSLDAFHVYGRSGRFGPSRDCVTFTRHSPAQLMPVAPLSQSAW